MLGLNHVQVLFLTITIDFDKIELNSRTIKDTRVKQSASRTFKSFAIMHACFIMYSIYSSYLYLAGSEIKLVTN